MTTLHNVVLFTTDSHFKKNPFSDNRNQSARGPKPTGRHRIEIQKNAK